MEITTNGHSLIGIVRSADLVQAAELMTKHDIGALGVYDLDAKKLLGIITDRDMTKAVADRRDPADTKVSDVMSAPVIRAEAPITNRQAKDIMQRTRVRHLVVADQGAHHIISLRDI